MTPLQVTMLMHYYAICAPYSEHNTAHAESEAVYRQRNNLVARGLIEVALEPSGYRVTDKGKCLIKHICELPNPISTTEWRMPA